MLNMQENPTTGPMEDVEMPGLDNQDQGGQYENKDNFADNENLFEQLISQTNSPPEQLLGMIDNNGVESIEYPVASGIFGKGLALNMGGLENN